MSVELSFQSAEALPLSKTPESVLVRWKIKPNLNVNLADYEFYVDRGDAQDQSNRAMGIDIDGKPISPAPTLTETANLSQLAGPINALDFYEYLDFTANFWDFYKVQYYQIRLRKISTQEEVTTQTFSVEGDLDPVGLYIVDEFNFLLEDAVGEPSFIYKRRSFGVQCTKCFDKVQQLRKISNCDRCFGTNWEGGFYDELTGYIDYSPSLDQVSIEQWGATQPNEIDAKLSNWPQLAPGDVIRELRRQRMWRVEKIQETEKRRVPMLQFVRLQEINIKDIEYRIPYNQDKALAITAEFEMARRRREF